MSRNTRVYGSDKSGEQLLWVNVILQAIRDATDGAFNTPLARQQARGWFRISNPDFIEVCSLGGLDPEATYEKAMAAIKRHDATIPATGEIMKRPARRPVMLHTYNGESLTFEQWAQRLGISVPALYGRQRKCGSLQAAIAMGSKVRGNGRPGVVSNFTPSKETGGQGSLQETPNLTFSQETAE